MSSALFVLAAPIALLAVFLLHRFGGTASRARLPDLGFAAAVLTVGVALVAAIAVILSGPLTSPAIGVGQLALVLRLDTLSVTPELLATVKRLS